MLIEIDLLRKRIWKRKCALTPTSIVCAQSSGMIAHWEDKCFKLVACWALIVSSPSSATSIFFTSIAIKDDKSWSLASAGSSGEYKENLVLESYWNWIIFKVTFKLGNALPSYSLFAAANRFGSLWYNLLASSETAHLRSSSRTSFCKSQKQKLTFGCAQSWVRQNILSECA